MFVRLAGFKIWLTHTSMFSAHTVLCTWMSVTGSMMPPLFQIRWFTYILSTFKRGDKMRLCHCCHCFQFRLFVCLLAGLQKYDQADFPESWGKVRARVKEDYNKILVSVAYTHHSTTNEWGTFINTDCKPGEQFSRQCWISWLKPESEDIIFHIGFYLY